MKSYLTGRTFELTCDVLGLNLDHILAESDIQLGTSTIANTRFSAAEVGRFFSTIMSEYEGDDIHIKASKEHVGNIYGTGELAFLMSSTLGEALQHMAKMKSLIKPVLYEICNTEDSLEIAVKCTDASFPMNAMLEIACFIYTVEAFRFHSGQKINARHIQLTSAVPHQDQIAKDLGCEINIADSCALIFDSSVGDIPLNATHPFLNIEVDKEISQTDITASFVDLTKQKIKARLIDDFSAESVAKSLALSKRTFERRLFKEGTSYRHLLDEIRSEMAVEYLTSTQYTLSEVSYLLGFQEPNSFLRAFKRWYNTTPSTYLKTEHLTSVFHT